jgi:hypothetical protein
MADQIPPPDAPEDEPKVNEPLLLRMELFLQIKPEDADPKQTLEDRIRYALNDMLSDMMINIQHRFDIKIEDGMVLLQDNPERAARFQREVKLGKRPN